MPYRDTEISDEVLRIIDERDKYQKQVWDLRDEFFAYRQRVFFWILTPVTLLVCVSAIYWALLLDLKHVNETMEPKHTCDPAPACELKLNFHK